MNNSLVIGLLKSLMVLGAYLLLQNIFVAQIHAQTPIPSPFPLLTQNTLFPPEPISTPSATSEFPFITKLQQSFDDQIASIPAEKKQSEGDYCLDIPMIMYHHIQPLPLAEKLGHAPLTIDATIFDEQIKFLKENNYRAISTEELVNALETRTQLPEKSIVITIDDGYDDNYTYAFLTAKKYQFVMNFMIPTGLIGTPGYMNWDHLREMKDNPYAKIYNHTTSHAALGLLTKEAISHEVITANADLQRELGLDNTIVTYPYGAYSDLAVQTLQEIGMRAAVSTDPGRNECVSNIMRLPRVRVGNAPIHTYGF